MLQCLQAVEFDVNKVTDSTGDLIIHVVVKQGQFVVTATFLHPVPGVQ